MWYLILLLRNFKFIAAQASCICTEETVVVLSYDTYEKTKESWIFTNLVPLSYQHPCTSEIVCSVVRNETVDLCYQ
jgi:hypothetical protein